MKKRLQSLKTKLGAPSTSKSKTNFPARSQNSQILNTTLNAAETSVRLLNQLSISVPFIGSATSATIYIIDQCKKYLDNAKDFEDLLKSLQSLESLLSPYKDEGALLPSEVMRHVKEFDSAISDIRSELDAFQSTSRISQFVNNSENEGRIQGLVKKVKDAIDKIMLASLLDVSRGIYAVSCGVQEVSHEVQDISQGVEKVAREVQEIALAQSLLSLNPVHSARYNCVDRDQCLDGTRVTVLDDIQKWFDTGEEQIYWLNGAAGMGKTTIALSVAHRLLSNSQLLMATFFCSRDSIDRKNCGLIFPTLACQLASWNSAYHDALMAILSRHPYIGAALPHEQVQRLLVEPLQQIQPPPTIALVIDALDECDGERASEKILLALLQHVQSVPSLKVFVSCRPAAYVEVLLSSGDHRRMFKLHHVPANIVDSDLRLFYNQQLQKICTAKKLGPEDWPSAELVEKLVRQAAGLFIFAVTVCKYVSLRGDVKRRLEYIANISKGDYKDALSVDMLYTEVLSSALEKIPDDQDRRDFARVLASVMLVQKPLTVDALGKLLRIETLVIYDLLRDVHSILSVPDEAGTLAGEVVHTFHASFPDYMTSCDRVGAKVPLLYIDTTEHHLELAHLCLQCMNKDLKRILPFSQRSFSNSEIQNLENLVESHISNALRYATLYWADHMSAVSPVGLSGHPILEELQHFANTKLLFWLECISLLNASESALEILFKGKNWLEKMKCDMFAQTLQLLVDAYHAVNEFFPMVQDFGVHIYLSFVLFLPQGTSLYKCYSHHLPPYWKVSTGHLEQTWNPLIGSKILYGFDSPLAFSPDGRNIAFVNGCIVSMDVLSLKQFNITKNLARMDAWDAEKIPGVDASFPELDNGVFQPSVTSLIWLPSGVIVTCCTILSSIKKPHECHCYVSLWDAETGLHKHLLYHTSEETNMFLPVMVANSRYLGISTPSTQLLWETENWQNFWVSPSPTPFYRCFSLSDDYYLIGMEMRQISNKCQILHTLDIDQQHVTSAMLINDGCLIILVLTNGLVELWQALPEPKLLSSYQLPPSSSSPNHSAGDPVIALPSVAYSPDTALIAASYDVYVSLLRIEENHLVLTRRLGSRNYHSQLRHVAFAPGGNYLVGSDANGMVHIWSATAAESFSNKLSSQADIKQPLSCIAYMEDGRFCVSGSYSGAISIWDCNTRSICCTWQSGHELRSIAVSPDGKFVASSGMESTCIWSLLQDFKLHDTKITIPAPPDIIDYIPSISAVTFNAASTMLAILTGFVIDIWKLTEGKGWERYTQIMTPPASGFVFHEDELDADDFDDDSFQIRPLRLNNQWLAHSYHRLPVRAPYYLGPTGESKPSVSDAEYERILLKCRSAFDWLKWRKRDMEETTHEHFQLYFSPTEEYILAPSGIYEIATGKEIKNYQNSYVPWEDLGIAELETKYFWPDFHKGYYKRNGILKSLRVHPSDRKWIADADGNRLFWLPYSYYQEDYWPWVSWYSYTSAGNNFAFLAPSENNFILVHVTNVDGSDL